MLRYCCCCSALSAPVCVCVCACDIRCIRAWWLWHMLLPCTQTRARHIHAVCALLGTHTHTRQSKRLSRGPRGEKSLEPSHIESENICNANVYTHSHTLYGPKCTLNLAECDGKNLCVCVCVRTGREIDSVAVFAGHIHSNARLCHLISALAFRFYPSMMISIKTFRAHFPAPTTCNANNNRIFGIMSESGP